MSKRPTASALHRAAYCLYPWSGIALPPSESSPAAAFGSAFHACAAFRITNGGTCITEAASGWKLTNEQYDRLVTMFAGWAAWWDDMAYAAPVSTEQAFAYNVDDDSCRLVDLAAPRDYSKFGSEFFGTADLVMRGVGPLTVTDWKTGDPANVERCLVNRQMRFLALCASRAYSVDNVVASIAFVDEDGSVTVDSNTFDVLDLANIAAEMRELQARLRGPIAPNPGQHCKWCPALSVCPSTQKAIEQVAPPEPPAEYKVSVAIESPDHAAWLRHRLGVILEAASAVDAALKRYADDNGGIALANGKRYAGKDVSTEHVKLTDAAADILHEMLPAAMTATTSKTAIHKACGKDKDKEATVLAALREAGAVSVSTSRRYEER